MKKRTKTQRAKKKQLVIKQRQTLKSALITKSLISCSRVDYITNLTVDVTTFSDQNLCSVMTELRSCVSGSSTTTLRRLKTTWT